MNEESTAVNSNEWRINCREQQRMKNQLLWTATNEESTAMNSNEWRINCYEQQRMKNQLLWAATNEESTAVNSSQWRINWCEQQPMKRSVRDIAWLCHWRPVGCGEISSRWHIDCLHCTSSDGGRELQWSRSTSSPGFWRESAVFATAVPKIPWPKCAGIDKRWHGEIKQKFSYCNLNCHFPGRAVNVLLENVHWTKTRTHARTHARTHTHTHTHTQAHTHTRKKQKKEEEKKRSWGSAEMTKKYNPVSNPIPLHNVFPPVPDNKWTKTFGAEDGRVEEGWVGEGAANDRKANVHIICTIHLQNCKSNHSSLSDLKNYQPDI